MNPVLFSLFTFVSTTAGGLCALGLRDRLHLVLAVSAGVLMGVVAFDLLPEIFELSQRTGVEAKPAMVALAGGFLLLHGLEKFVLVHHVHEADYAPHHHPGAGVLSTVALIAHSFIDGLGIGLAFQVSPAVGLTVAIAVIAHDFCDGLNTVGLMLMHRSTTARALGMLALDAIAPILGALSSLAFDVPAATLPLYLGCFAGVLLYISVSDILPQAHSRAGPSGAGGLVALTVLGATLVYVVTRLTH
jgi:ZIP family zinc transporter